MVDLVRELGHRSRSRLEARLDDGFAGNSADLITVKNTLEEIKPALQRLTNH